jgi:hypothetical protein
VLRVISSSPGELEPVFETMLANAVRICEAKFGVLYRYENQPSRRLARRATAIRRVPAATWSVSSGGRTHHRSPVVDQEARPHR